MLSMEGEQHWRLLALDDDKTYRVATNSFVAAQASKNAPRLFKVEDSQQLVRDVLVDYIETYGLRIDQPSR